MTRSDISEVLNRVLNDYDFYNQMLIQPEKALEGYILTKQEHDILMKQDDSIYSLLRDKELPVTEEDPPPTVVVVIVVVAITALLANLNDEAPPVSPRIREIGEEIKTLQGNERYERILNMLDELNGKPAENNDQ